MTSAPNHPADPIKQGNQLIGERVHTLMWRSSRTQKQLAAILNVDQGSVSNRLHGKTNWSAVEVAAVAQWLDVPITDLMPEVELDGGPPEPGGASYRIAGHTLPLPRLDSNQEPFDCRHAA